MALQDAYFALARHEEAPKSGLEQMPILNPKALVEARKRKGWTQVQLSEQTKPQINVSTISRIERAKPSRVRERTLKQIAVALGVHPAELCQAATSESDLVKLPMDTAARNALALVAKRYGIRRRTVIELAPLLFYIAAEQSLLRRRMRLAEIREAADSLNHLQHQIPHLPLDSWVPADSFEPERASIEARDLFGRKIVERRQFMMGYLKSYDEAEDNPFAAFLNEALDAVRGPDHPDKGYGPVQCPASSEPRYGICHAEAAEIVAGDEEAAAAIVDGRVALHEMPKGAPSERAEWVRGELTQVVTFDNLDAADF